MDNNNMWHNRCRCCMSADCKVSLLDPQQNLKERFFDVTDIEVKDGEGLPHKLCDNCYSAMNKAHQFRKKCIQTDQVLKKQSHEALLEEGLKEEKLDESMNPKLDMFEIEKNTMEPLKKLETFIKSNGLDGDDDYCYVVVIGNPKGTQRNEDTNNVTDNKTEEMAVKYEDSDEYYDDDYQYLSDYSYHSEGMSDYEDSDDKEERNGDHICKICGKCFESAEILTGHTLLHSSTGLLINCPFCQQPIKRNALTMHIKTGHINEKPCCNVCFKMFSTKSHLKRHMAVHEDRNLKEFECDLCFKSFPEKYAMQMHRLTHTHPYYCSQCDQTFLNRTLLNEHKTKGCSKSDRKRDEFMIVKQGNIRGRPKKFPGTMQPPRRNPRPKTNPQCYECGEVLTNKRELQIHIQTTHENYNGDKMKRFECSICRKRFTSGAKLTMHERVHTNERPYACELCSNRFKTKTHLRTHQLTHSKEKKYTCPLCPKQFNLKYNLRGHLRCHADESSIKSTPKRKTS